MKQPSFGSHEPSMGSVAADISLLYSHAYNAVRIRMPEASKYIGPSPYTTPMPLKLVLNWHSLSSPLAPRIRRIKIGTGRASTIYNSSGPRRLLCLEYPLYMNTQL